MDPKIPYWTTTPIGPHVRTSTKPDVPLIIENHIPTQYHIDCPIELLVPHQIQRYSFNGIRTALRLGFTSACHLNSPGPEPTLPPNFHVGRPCPRRLQATVIAHRCTTSQLIPAIFRIPAWTSFVLRDLVHSEIGGLDPPRGTALKSEKHVAFTTFILFVDVTDVRFATSACCRMWTALKLALKHGFGGRSASHKAVELANYVVAWLVHSKGETAACTPFPRLPGLVVKSFNFLLTLCTDHNELLFWLLSERQVWSDLEELLNHSMLIQFDTEVEDESTYQVF